nr:unnamed protein product [Spirometra erinaceieuropaei]
MSSRQQIQPGIDNSRNPVSKIPRLLRQNTHLKNDSSSVNDQPVWVEAVDAVGGNHTRIMYSNAKAIGSGSFGMVFVALLNGEQEVAIKKVLQDKRYKNRELQILRELRHPNIVSLLYFFYSVSNSIIHLALIALHTVSPFHPIRAPPFSLTVNAPVLYPIYLTSDRLRLIMSSDSDNQPIAGIHTFDLPSVWLGDIALWLRTVESRFALRQITREDTKFHYVVAALPMDIAIDLRDIIDCPPTEAPYTALKEALISRISLSTQKRLQRLISEEDLGDRKPTQLLRRLEQLADRQKLDAAMFKQLFLQRLPPSVQAILAPNIPSSTVQMLAQTADRILEYYQPPVTVNVASRSTTAPTIEDVVKRLDALTLEVSQLRATRVYNPRSPAISRRPRSPTPNKPTVDGFCWYHHNYGSNAHRCHSPCKYKTPASENSPADQ